MDKIDTFLEKKLKDDHINRDDFERFYKKLYHASIRNTLNKQTPNQKEVCKIIQNYTVYFDKLMNWYIIYCARIGKNEININKDGQIEVLKD